MIHTMPDPKTADQNGKPSLGFWISVLIALPSYIIGTFAFDYFERGLYALTDFKFHTVMTLLFWLVFIFVVMILAAFATGRRISRWAFLVAAIPVCCLWTIGFAPGVL